MKQEGIHSLSTFFSVLYLFLMLSVTPLFPCFSSLLVPTNQLDVLQYAFLE